MNYLHKLCLHWRRAIKAWINHLDVKILALMPQNHDQIAKQERTLEILSSLSYRTGELPGYLKLIANGVSELIGLDWAVVTLCRDGFERVLASSIDMGDEVDQLFELHGTLTGTVINSGLCLFVEDTSINKEYGAPPEGYLAYIGAPLKLPNGEIIGTICAFCRDPRKFDESEMRLVEIFAERAATAIDNYNLYHQQQVVNQTLLEEIKERQEAEQALRMSEEQLRQIAENLQPVVWMYSCDGQPIYISPMFEKVWGISCEQWYDDPTVCLNAIHTEDRDRVSVAFQGILTNNSNYDLEYRIVRPDGSIKTIYDRGFPIVDDRGTIFRVAGISEDISERQQEQQKIIKAMARLSEIGELATTIVHEVRNPLTTVLMGLNFFDRMELPDNAKKRLTLALDEAERLRRLLNEILLYAKHETIHTEPIDLNKLALDLIENVSSMSGIIDKQILFNPTSADLVVLADIDKLKQVLINLLQNACEAVSEGESIVLQIIPLATPRLVCIQVQNAGAPIPSELLPKLTQPFFTTKSSGNGLGLAIVKKIVEAHKGTLEIESSASTGTIIRVNLPID